MVPSPVLSIALLAAAGLLIDTHLRDWRGARATLAEGPRTPASEAAERFARRRRTRRLIASGAIAVVGVLIGLWPLVPQRPWWVASFAAVLGAIACLILVLGVADALANSRYYRAERRRLLAAERAALEEMIGADSPSEPAAERVPRT